MFQIDEVGLSFLKCLVDLGKSVFSFTQPCVTYGQAIVVGLFLLPEERPVGTPIAP
jgi:hypothetical protein